MVAPTTGILKRIIDEMAVQLDTVDDLRVYKYPVDSVQEFPAALIRDNHATNQTVAAEYRSTTSSTEAVYHLEVLVLVDQADEPVDHQSWDNTVVSGVQAAECIKAEPRRPTSRRPTRSWRSTSPPTVPPPSRP